MKWKKDDIIAYYKRTEFGYRLWGRNMHYGYWDKDVKSLRQATVRFNEVLAKQALITKNDHVLDAGCGVGGASIFLAKTIGCTVKGITICPKQVGHAYKNSKKEGVSHLTEFHEMDYLATDFPDNHFDVVWALESLCYAKSKERFIQEAYRILKKGGRLIVADGFASQETYNPLEKKMMDKWLDGWIVNDLETPEAFIHFAKKNSFHTVSYQDVTKKVFRTSQIIHYVSYIFFIFHMIDKFFPLKTYPSDAMFHQYKAMKQGLWQYGIFYAVK